MGGEIDTSFVTIPTRKPISPWQIKVADEMLKLVENAGRQSCQLEIKWAGHIAVRAWRDGDGLHVEFPEGGC